MKNAVWLMSLVVGVLLVLAGWLSPEEAALAGGIPIVIGATFKSCEGLLRVEDSGMPGTFLTLGEITGYTIEEVANIRKYFKIGTCNEQSSVTGISRSMSLEYNWDPTDVGQPELVIGATVNFEIYPRGNTPGKEKWTATGVVGTVSRNAPAAEDLTRSCTVEINTWAEAVVP